jgi:hypothetical protein
MDAELRRPSTMSETLQRLKEQARAPRPDERLDHVEDLLANLEDVGGTSAAEWTAEAENRLAAFHSGALGAVRIFEKCRGA